MQLQNIFISSSQSYSTPLDYSILVHKSCEKSKLTYSLGFPQHTEYPLGEQCLAGIENTTSLKKEANAFKKL